MEERKIYHLIGEDGKPYDSFEKGTLGGRWDGKVKIYGRLDCPAALRAIASGRGTYEKNRVFFKDEETAKKAGFRPCGTCMREEFLKWRAEHPGEKF